jgi:Lon protease-like protein
VILPGTRSTVVLASVASLGAIKEALLSREAPIVGAFSAFGTSMRDANELGPLGVLAAVCNLQRTASGGWAAEVQGVARARLHAVRRSEPFAIGEVERIEDAPSEGAVVAALVARLRAMVHETAVRWPDCQLRKIADALRAARPEEVAGVVTPLLPELATADWLALLDANCLSDRLALVLAHLHAARWDRRY